MKIDEKGKLDEELDGVVVELLDELVLWRGESFNSLGEWGWDLQVSSS